MSIPASPADSKISDTNPNGPAAIFHLTDRPSIHVFDPLSIKLCSPLATYASDKLFLSHVNSAFKASHHYYVHKAFIPIGGLLQKTLPSIDLLILIYLY